MTNTHIITQYLDFVFNKKDLAKVETFWKGDMIQHNPSMPNGLDVLRGFIQMQEEVPAEKSVNGNPMFPTN